MPFHTIQFTQYVLEKAERENYDDQWTIRHLLPVYGQRKKDSYDKNTNPEFNSYLTTSNCVKLGENCKINYLRMKTP